MKKIFLLVISLFFVISAWTQKTWTGAVNNRWDNAGNWSPGGIPVATDIVQFNNGLTLTVTNVPTQTIGQLLITNNTKLTLDGPGGPGKILTIGNAIAGIDLLIGSGSSLSNSGSLDGITIASNSTSDISGILNIDAGSIFNNDAVGVITTVAGTINNFASLVCTNASRLLFISSGTYVHALDGGIIPSATWDVASNCNIIGITNNKPGGLLLQSFGNFTWQCNHAANTTINLNSELTSIQGNFNVLRAGRSGGGRVTAPLALSSNNSFTLNVGGNVNINTTTEATWLALTTGTASAIMNIGGNFNMSGSVSFFDFNAGLTQNSLVINLTGNLNISGGLFDWAFTPTAGSNFTQLNLNGNFILSGTGAMTTSTVSTTIPNGKMKFVKSGLQSISVSSPANLLYTNFEVSSGSTVELLSTFNLTSQGAPYAIKGGKFEVLSGGSVDMKTFQLLSTTGLTLGANNSFTLNAGAKVITANNRGLHNITTAGIGSVSSALATRTFSSDADYEFQGDSTGTFVTTAIAATARDIIINNPTGNVTLNQPMAVTQNLQLLDGELKTTYTNLITVNAGAAATGYSDASFVVGPILKKGSTDFEFPVGRTTAGLIPVKISNLSGASDFRAEYVRIPASSLGPVTAPGLHHVSHCEYWRLERVSGTATANVTMYWNPFSNCSLPANIQNPFSLFVAHFNGTSWNVYGRDGFPTGNVSSGTVTWNNVSVFDPAFSPFALGTTEASNIPLKVSLANIKAYQLGTNIQIEWSNLTETDVINYVVEKSADGIEFSTIGQLSPRSNSNDRQEYSLPDYSPFAGANYYRIRVLEKIGRVTLSKTIKVEIGKSVTDKFIIYPNPVRDKLVSVNINGWEKGQYKIRVFNSSGQQVFARSINYQGGSMTEIVQLPTSIGHGYYSMLIGNEKIQRNQSFIVQ